MRSSWIKYARAVEHQQVLARAGREFFADGDTYEYRRSDNRNDEHDPLLRIEWTPTIKRPFPERWSVVLGDVLTNFRAALDHAVWDAVHAHSGPPDRPQDIFFPIATEQASFRKNGKKLRSLLPPPVWGLIEEMQPFHETDATTAPLEVLRWLSNVDKHRAVHVVGSTFFDVGLPLVLSDPPLDIVDEYRYEGQATDGTVVARVTAKRPQSPQTIEVRPTFAHGPTLQIRDNPVDFRRLGEVMDVLRDSVLAIIGHVTIMLGAPTPERDELNLGEEHDAYAPELGGVVLGVTDHDGTRHIIGGHHRDAHDTASDTPPAP
ncbi:hypothetical protein [Actinopolyspora erythraea]|uniref:hypothetical protein n=1 Tax=Actinopolyspora erythraea TaxID=414996 RepID=UPI000A06FB02